MNRLTQSSLYLLLFVCAGAFGITGCHKNQTSAASSGSASQEQGPDPAAANLAPGENGGSAPSGASYTTENAPAPSEGSAQDDSDYNEQATETAPDPPPALPDYSQPPDPGDGYIWTPGYWGWASTGYYWVPGAWVEPPYEGALWTPGYWGSSGGRYMFYPGHWGTHIGFYGGVNYGFGYGGTGYEGGYWNGGHFLYNRDYNNVNVNVVHNVYTYHVNRAANTSRVSFHGGSQGVQRHPEPQEKAAWHEPVAPRMSTQVQHAKSAQSNRGQFYSANHGRPPSAAVSKPVAAEHNVRPAMPRAPAPRASAPKAPERPARPQEKPAPGNQRDDRH
ncbi:MAG: hypothetical protein WBC92_08840 [Terracidiphilus sp.]